MANTIYFKFSILMMASCAGVVSGGWGHFEHWLRVIDLAADCAGASPGDQVPDPTDCKNFYMCTGDGTMFHDPLPCPDEFRCFDPDKSDCSTDETACNKACVSTAPVCKTECDPKTVNPTTLHAMGDHIADLTNCQRHFVCLGGPTDDKIEVYCPDERPHFNGKECVNDKTQCCMCQPGTCENSGDFLPDPQNCHAFYVCVEVGDPAVITPLGPYTCSDGGSFVNGICDAATTECENICDLETTTSSASSTTTTTTSSASSTTTTPTSNGPSTATTTSTPPPPTTTAAMTTTTTDGCTDLSDFTCPGNGFYARCIYCDPSYFKCDGPAGAPTQGSCAGELVFNPDPAFPFCMRPENCPFHPFSHFNP